MGPTEPEKVTVGLPDTPTWHVEDGAPLRGVDEQVEIRATKHRVLLSMSYEQYWDAMEVSEQIFGSTLDEVIEVTPEMCGRTLVFDGNEYWYVEPELPQPDLSYPQFGADLAAWKVQERIRQAVAAKLATLQLPISGV